MGEDGREEAEVDGGEGRPERIRLGGGGRVMAVGGIDIKVLKIESHKNFWSETLHRRFLIPYGGDSYHRRLVI